MQENRDDTDIEIGFLLLKSSASKLGRIELHGKWFLYSQKSVLESNDWKKLRLQIRHISCHSKDHKTVAFLSSS